MSPTFREEEQLEKREALTDKEQARDFVRIFKSVFQAMSVTNNE
jgi:hypothetical protein